MDACLSCPSLAVAKKLTPRAYFYVYDMPHDRALHNAELWGVFGNAFYSSSDKGLEAFLSKKFFPAPNADLIATVQRIWKEFIHTGSINELVEGQSLVPGGIFRESGQFEAVDPRKREYLQNEVCPIWTDAADVKLGHWGAAKLCFGSMGDTREELAVNILSIMLYSWLGEKSYVCVLAGFALLMTSCLGCCGCCVAAWWRRRRKLIEKEEHFLTSGHGENVTSELVHPSYAAPAVAVPDTP